jgi:hypothetical protein
VKFFRQLPKTMPCGIETIEEKRYFRRMRRKKKKTTPIDLMPLITTDYCGRQRSKGNQVRNRKGVKNGFAGVISLVRHVLSPP